MSNPKVVAIPVYQLENVVSSLRHLANRIETGEIACDCALVIQGNEGEYARYSSFGVEGYKWATIMGLIEMTKQHVLSDSGLFADGR